MRTEGNISTFFDFLLMIVLWGVVIALTIFWWPLGLALLLALTLRLRRRPHWLAVVLMWPYLKFYSASRYRHGETGLALGQEGIEIHPICLLASILGTIRHSHQQPIEEDRAEAEAAFLSELSPEERLVWDTLMRFEEENFRRTSRDEYDERL